MSEQLLQDRRARFDVAWEAACVEHGRLMTQYGHAEEVPDSEWSEYRRLRQIAQDIASEAGPVGSADRMAVVYGGRPGGSISPG